MNEFLLGQRYGHFNYKCNYWEYIFFQNALYLFTTSAGLR
jgi:hypothetical protein